MKHDSEEKEFVSDSDNEMDDWYNDSDTSAEIPDPNEDVTSLYQDCDQLPISLSNGHFEEGMIYSLTLFTDKKLTLLGMVMETREDVFRFRIFHAQQSSKKTFHEGARDLELKYSTVWRLAPRRELMRPIRVRNTHPGLTLRFEYDDVTLTALVIKKTSSNLTGILECGPNRGDVVDFTLYEIVNCFELFYSSKLSSLFHQVSTAT